MTSPAPDYTVAVTDMDGVTVIADLPVSTLVFSKTLNAPGACEFTMPMWHPDCTQANLSVGQRRVEVYRDGDLVWGGDLWSVALDAAAQSVRFLCNGYFERLRHRLFEENLFYKNVEQVTVAWGLIAYAQSLGDLHITNGGAGATGIKRNRHYCAWTSGTIGDAIVELAESENGFDFEITPDLVWNLWHERRGASVPVKVFTFGDSPDDDTNIWELHYEDDAANIANRIAGNPDEDCQDVSDFVVVENASSITDYGLFHDVLDLPNMKHRDDMVAYLREELRIRKRSRKQIRITTPDTPWDPIPDRTPPAYEVGDLVSLTADLGYESYSLADFRVMSWEVELNEGQEVARVLLDSVTT